MPNVERQTQPPSGGPHITEASIRGFIENQRLEMQYKMAELEQRKSEDDHGYEYSLKALDAQQVDRSEMRKHFFAYKRVFFIFSSIVLLIFLVFVGWALNAGHEEFLTRIIERGLYFAAGGASMYGYGRYKMYAEKDEED